MSDKFSIELPNFKIRLSNTGRYEVNHDSDFQFKQALEKFARYFKAESRYDQFQYFANVHDESCVGFLFTDSALDLLTEADFDDNGRAVTPTRCLGGACFRKEHFGNDERWALHWVWLHPFSRQRGILSKHWPYFQQRFGDFRLELPLSHAMQSFIDKKKGAAPT